MDMNDIVNTNNNSQFTIHFPKFSYREFPPLWRYLANDIPPMQFAENGTRTLSVPGIIQHMSHSMLSLVINDYYYHLSK